MADLTLRLPAESTSLAQIRNGLARWLADEGMSEAIAFDVVAAASEAAANAIEHAEEPQAPVVELDATRHGTLLTVRVRDYGRWREPRLNSDRNRGLLLISGLMTHVDVDRSLEGTVVTMRLDLAATAGAAGPLLDAEALDPRLGSR
jgi:anti-sigma regulatory factor (Ser/Thr protein kinase)